MCVLRRSRPQMLTVRARRRMQENANCSRCCPSAVEEDTHLLNPEALVGLLTCEAGERGAARVYRLQVEPTDGQEQSPGSEASRRNIHNRKQSGTRIASLGRQADRARFGGPKFAGAVPQLPPGPSATPGNRQQASRSQSCMKPAQHAQHHTQPTCLARKPSKPPAPATGQPPATASNGRAAPLGGHAPSPAPAHGISHARAGLVQPRQAASLAPAPILSCINAFALHGSHSSPAPTSATPAPVTRPSHTHSSSLTLAHAQGGRGGDLARVSARPTGESSSACYLA